MQNLSRAVLAIAVGWAMAGAASLQAASSQSKYSSAVVRQAQTTLKDQGLYHGALDGISGPKTHSALREYQRSQNLSVTGRLDDQTLDQLGVNGTANREANGEANREAPASTANTVSVDTAQAAQRALQDKGFYNGPIDGIVGPNTRAAIREYQAKNNYPVDGMLTEETAQHLGVATPGSYYESAGSAIGSKYSQAGSQVANGTTGMAHRMSKGEVGSGAVKFGKGIGKGAESVAQEPRRPPRRSTRGPRTPSLRGVNRG